MGARARVGRPPNIDTLVSIAYFEQIERMHNVCNLHGLNFRGAMAAAVRAWLKTHHHIYPHPGASLYKSDTKSAHA